MSICPFHCPVAANLEPLPHQINGFLRQRSWPHFGSRELAGGEGPGSPLSASGLGMGPQGVSSCVRFSSLVEVLPSSPGAPSCPCLASPGVGRAVQGRAKAGALFHPTYWPRALRCLD